jgi:enoyl-CoA hydratase
VLAVCTDLRVASSEGKYGLTEVRVGVPYPQGAIGVVRAELAPQAVRRLAFGNELHDADTCLRLGVFDEIVEPDAVLPRAQEIARELASLPADVYARTKNDLRGATIDRLRVAAVDDPLLARWV